ncbi:MAG: hypothetical protein B0D91_01655 [Oceanospirillales bacterium LUC14_002_19_P2]|nr:MAG: hypothetical protein B0D91_01655 [Oceanospirillales bacterium LUC14_002_19_P2]
MNIFVIIDETSFYHPQFLADFLDKTNDQVVGVGVVTKIPEKHNIERYMVRNWRYLTIPEIARLGIRKYFYKACDVFQQFVHNKTHWCSVRSVCKDFDLDWFEIHNDINQKCYLVRIAEAKPDIIISSCSLIFGEALLSLPSIACINRHSALLPAYKGLWPVFQAVRNGEEYTGVSIHTMERTIDTGKVLSFRKVPITTNTSVSTLYSRCFEVSTDALLEALDNIRNDHWQGDATGQRPSYFSFPTAEQWAQFRKRGGRFI